MILLPPNQRLEVTYQRIVPLNLEVGSLDFEYIDR